MRGDLGQVTKAHAGLYRQLQEQNAQIAEVGEEMKRARLSLEQHEHRLATVEQQVTAMGWWVKLGISLVVILLVVVIWLLVRAR